jgi:hypothetical protein
MNGGCSLLPPSLRSSSRLAPAASFPFLPGIGSRRPQLREAARPGPEMPFVMFDPGGFEPRPSSSNSADSTLRWITIVKALCRGRSQYKCQSRHKQGTKSHHCNCDGIISGNLEHREAPKIADRPVWSPKWPKVDIRLFKEEKNDLLWLVKPTAKAKTVQNCSDRTSLGNVLKPSLLR